MCFIRKVGTLNFLKVPLHMKLLTWLIYNWCVTTSRLTPSEVQPATKPHLGHLSWIRGLAVVDRTSFLKTRKDNGNPFAGSYWKSKWNHAQGHTRLGLVINLRSRRGVGESCWARTVNATHVATLIGEAERKGEDGWFIWSRWRNLACGHRSWKPPWLGFSQPDKEHEAKVQLNVCKKRMFLGTWLAGLLSWLNSGTKYTAMSKRKPCSRRTE